MKRSFFLRPMHRKFAKIYFNRCRIGRIAQSVMQSLRMGEGCKFEPYCGVFSSNRENLGLGLELIIANFISRSTFWSKNHQFCPHWTWLSSNRWIRTALIEYSNGFPSTEYSNIRIFDPTLQYVSQTYTAHTYISHKTCNAKRFAREHFKNERYDHCN